MRAVRARVTKGITIGTLLKCDDNSGARVLKVIGVKGWHGVLRRYPRAGVGDVVIVSVVKGSPKVRKKVMKAVIIRQRMPYRRRNGWHVRFEDNAAVLINEDGTPRGTEIKGVVAREVAERFPKVAGIAAAVI